MKTPHRMHQGNRLRYAPACAWLCALFALLLAAAPACAHRVTVFAWVENGMVHTESKFGGGREAKGATVEVYDGGGRLLLTGTTDDQGAFSFPVPQVTDLEVVLKAGTGHAGSWSLPESEVRAGAGGDPTNEPPPASAVVAEKDETAEIDEAAPPAPAGGSGSAEALKAVVETALQEQLRPVVQRLARLESRAAEPGVKDVVGGIGYIVGMAGIAAWAASRKRGR